MNIDKSFKKSLEGHEMPYDPKAWEAMSKKLDQTMPSGSGSNWKWYLGGAAVVGVIVGSALIFNSGKEETHTAKTNPTEIHNEKNVANSVSESNTHSDQSTNTANNGSVTNNSSNDQAPANGSDAISPATDNVAQQTNPGTNENQGNVQLPVQKQNNQTQTPEPVRIKEVILPQVENMCEGESIKIDNRNNDVAIYVINPSNEKTTIKAGVRGSFEAKEDGTHFIAHIVDGKIVKKESFVVMSAPQVDMSYNSSEIYNDEGVPTTSMTSGSSGSNFVWEVNNTKLYGKNVEAHLFNKGNYPVKLTLTGSNGCKATETMTVSIENNYNLIAPLIFNPNSTIPVNTTWMPDALKRRNTPFTLMIFDPANGAPIYETNDASQPWTGVDRRNGQMVEFNKNYPWKVILKNPMEGEKSEYVGTVVLTPGR